MTDIKKFVRSLGSDYRLLADDVFVRKAHASMLREAGILTISEQMEITYALTEIEKEVTTFGPNYADEDIHTLVERLLIQKIGATGKKLHAGLSRNDLVATEEILYIARIANDLRNSLCNLEKAFRNKAESVSGWIMPGFTHLQHAQPIYLKEHLLAYCGMFKRDMRRLSNMDFLCPSGSGAIAGTSILPNRDAIAKNIGLYPYESTVDAVSDRDYVIEIASICSIIMMHLSRFAEEMVLWNSQEFSFVVFPDELVTGSSMMPQKRNPDIAELIRGKAGKVYGDLMNLLTMMKGLPLAYNRDMQCDKEPLFSAVETTADCILMAQKLIEGVEFQKRNMQAQLNNGNPSATDLAEYLVKKGMPFRDAHKAVSEIVRYAEASQMHLNDVWLEVLKDYAPLVEEDVYSVLDPSSSPLLQNARG